MMTSRKREKTLAKIVRASMIIRAENVHRRGLNEKREKLIKKGKTAPGYLPILRPAFVCAEDRSNKYLCGIFSQMVDVLRGANVPIPRRR